MNKDALAFQPPEPSSLFISLCKFLLPVYSCFRDHLSFRIKDTGSVAALQNQNTIIVLNHSDRQDPLVVIALAKYFGEEFYTMAAREIFDWHYGILGWMLRKFGCYSINRGVADHKSIAATKEILQQGKRKLLIFPEAEITADEHKIHKISTALVHIFLEAQEQLHSIDKERSIWILPVGVSYHLTTPFAKSVEKALHTVENHIGLDPTRSIDQRIDAAIRAILNNLISHYNCQMPENLKQHEQVEFLIHHICQRIAHYVGNSQNFHSIEKMQYALRNDVMQRLRTAINESHHEIHLAQSDRTIFREFINDLDRVERLSIFSRILQRERSLIQACRILDFLEMETTGQVSSKGRQEVSIFISDPIKVSAYFELFDRSKREAIDTLHSDIHDRLQLALDRSQPEFNDQTCSQVCPGG